MALLLLPRDEHDRSIAPRNEAIEAGTRALTRCRVRDYDHGDAAVFQRAYKDDLVARMRNVDTALHARMDWYNAHGDVDELVDELTGLYDSAGYFLDEREADTDKWTLHVDVQMRARAELLRPGMMSEVVCCTRTRLCGSRTAKSRAYENGMRLLQRIQALRLDTTHVYSFQLQLVVRMQCQLNARARIQAEQTQRAQVARRQACLIGLYGMAESVPLDTFIASLRQFLAQTESEAVAPPGMTATDVLAAAAAATASASQ